MRKLKVIAGLLLVGVLLLTVACGAAPVAEEMDEGGKIVGSAPGITIWEEANEEDYAESRAESSPSVVIVEPPEIDIEQQLGTERMIVRTGTMSLVVNDVQVATEEITGMAESLGGYLVSSRVWKDDDYLSGYISIRVPAEYYNDAIVSLRGLAVEVNSEQTSSQDVTEEYTDLDAQLHNLEATEAQLLNIMEKAETVEEILDVQSELSDTRGEIERITARMQYLERTSSTSLIEVYLEQSRIEIEFSADKRRGLKEGEKIQFSIRQIAGGFPPYSYEWDFGDGEVSTDENPTHAYKDADYYTVSLTVTDDEGNTDTETRDSYITVLSGWSAGSIASAAWNGLVIFGHVVGNIIIWLGIFSPVWIVIGGIVYGTIRWRRRRAKKTQ